MKCSLSKTVDDSKLGTLPDILEGRPAIQRALDRLKKWVDRDHLKQMQRQIPGKN